MRYLTNCFRSMMLLGLFCTPVSATLGALLKVGGGLTVFTAQWRQHWRQIVRWPVFWSILFFIAWMLFNMIHSAASTHYRLKIFLHYAAFLPICFIAAPLFKDKFWRSVLFNIIILAAFLLAINYWLVVHNIFNYISSGLQVKLARVSVAKLQEQSVLFSLGIYLSLVQISFSIFGRQDDKSLFLNIKIDKVQNKISVCLLFMLPALIIFYVLLQVQSERVGVVLCAVLLLILPLQIFRLKTALKCLLIMGVLLSIAFIASSGVREKVMRTYTTYRIYQSTGVDRGGRISGFHSAWNLWRKKPLLGYGTGTFSNGNDKNMPVELGMDVENNYMGLLAQQGLIGLGLWLLMLLAMWRCLLPCPMFEKTIGTGVLVAVALAANSYPAFLVNNSMAWLVAVLAACYGSLLHKKSEVVSR